MERNYEEMHHVFKLKNNRFKISILTKIIVIMIFFHNRAALPTAQSGLVLFSRFLLGPSNEDTKLLYRWGVPLT